MKHLIGMQSNTYIADNEFKIDFAKFKEYGIDCLDYQNLMEVNGEIPLLKLPEEEFVAFFDRLKKEIDKYGLRINQLHSLWDPVYEYNHQNEDMIVYFERAILAASILKTKYVVMHTVPLKGHYLWENVPYQEIFNYNKEFVNRLLPLAKKSGVYLAIENLPFLGLPEFFSPTGTLKLINDINDENVVMCLDTGHFNMFKEEKIYDFLVNSNGKVQCLHIHDNNGQSDAHQIPYLGNFDWNMFIKGLKDSNFQGVLSLETKIPNNKLNEKAYQSLNEGLIAIIKDMRDQLDN